MARSPRKKKRPNPDKAHHVSWADCLLVLRGAKSRSSPSLRLSGRKISPPVCSAKWLSNGGLGPSHFTFPLILPAHQERLLPDKALPALEELEDLRCRVIGCGSISEDDARCSRSLVIIKPSSNLIRIGCRHHGKTQQHLIADLC